MKSLLHIPYFMVCFITHQRRLKSKNLKGQSVIESHLMKQILYLKPSIYGHSKPHTRCLTYFVLNTLLKQNICGRSNIRCLILDLIQGFE